MQSLSLVSPGSSGIRLLNVPEGKPRSFRLSAHSLSQLDRLCSRLDKTRSEAVAIAVTHLLATVERSQPVWVTVPSEDPDAKPSADHAQL